MKNKITKKRFILNTETIYSLLKQNENEKRDLELLKKQLEEQKPFSQRGSFSRLDIYKAHLFDDMHLDGYVMKYPHGNVIRQSDRSWHYRGENACYPTSQSSFIRKISNRSKEEKLIAEIVANLRLAEFCLILNKLDHYHYFRDLHFTKGDSKVFLDVLFTNVAQHYGFDTIWLDRVCL